MDKLRMLPPLILGAFVIVLCTPHNEVIALDAETGVLRWRFDPRVSASGVSLITCRGVSYFEDTREGLCKNRIDGRLFALDADTGKLCANFGRDGFVDLRDGLVR